PRAGRAAEARVGQGPRARVEDLRAEAHGERDRRDRVVGRRGGLVRPGGPGGASRGALGRQAATWIGTAGSGASQDAATDGSARDRQSRAARGADAVGEPPAAAPGRTERPGNRDRSAAEL